MDREDIHEFIRRIRPSLIKQLNFDAVQHLYDKGQISFQDYTEIKNIKTRENQIIRLLDKLPSQSKDCYSEFRNYIREYYNWIFQEYSNTYYYEGDSTNREIMSILSAAEVPELPPKHVSREQEFATLNNFLHRMSRGEYVVVHGMGGSGKSTLVIEVLRQSASLVLDTFKRKILWHTVGRESTLRKDNQPEGRDLTILQELYQRLFLIRGYNAPNLPLEIKSAKRILTEKLRESDLQDCLLILDDVPSSDFIECLDIGCKILVTTDNICIMKKTNKPIYSVEVSSGFTENESLTLFAKNLACDKSKLPSQAKYIHALCKGFPLTVSLVASQLADFKEDALRNNDRWDSYITHLKNKDLKSAIGRYDEHRQEQITLLYNAIELSIKSLGHLKPLYEDFAIFMDDVNIKPEVLSTLWNLSKKEVEDIMLEFDKKCLVVRTWNSNISSYVYCVHDLLLDYLKRPLTETERKNLHQKLIARYQAKYGNMAADFPTNDNYIFLYLGYHLKEAEYYEEFPKLYLDLKFIESKIMAHGPADVLYDFKKYKNYIANTEENLQKYEELTDFISRIGVCLLISRADIVQFGLAECRDSTVYKMAAQMAKNSNKKYFEYLTDTPKDCSSPDVHHYREAYTAAIFYDRNIILANEAGTIKLVDSNTKQSIITFKGHQFRVTHLQLYPNKLFFLSAGGDSVIHIWSLYCMEKYTGKPRTPSPQLSQLHWKDAWGSQRSSHELPALSLRGHQNPLVDVQFSPKGKFVVSSGEDKRVIIWRLVLDQLTMELTNSSRELITVNETVISCRFTVEEDLLICAHAAGGLVSIYDVFNGELRSTIRFDKPIKSIAVIPDSTREGIKERAFNEVTSQIQVLIMGENYLSLNNISRRRMNSFTPVHNVTHDKCICAAVSHNGKYVAVALTNYNIFISEVKTLKEVAKFHETNGKIRTLNWSDNKDVLMTTYENRVWKIWNLDIEDSSNKAVKLKKSVFDATWVPYSDGDSEEDGLLITAALDFKNNINVFHDLRLVKMVSAECPVSNLCICQKETNLVYACMNGSVHIVISDKWTDLCILNIDCIRVCRMKAFYYEDTMVVLVLVEKETGKFSLVGWINNNSDEEQIYGYEVQYVNTNPSIFDFNADIRNSFVYVAKNDHSCNIYDLTSGVLRNTLDDERPDELEPAVFADFSSNFLLMATGNEKHVVVTDLNTNDRMKIEFETLNANVCKFNYEGTYLAIGFTCGMVHIHPFNNDEPLMKISEHSSNVTNLSWSPINNRLIVVLDRDIALYEVSSGKCNLISVIYMSVDKVSCNNAFSKIVTVDSSGHFHVLKHPL